MFNNINQKELLIQLLGIEPRASAWQAEILPLNHSCL